MKKKPTLKIKEKTKILMLLLLIFIFTTGVHVQRIQPSIVEWTWYEVESGDTLWNITIKYNDNNKDIRDLVRQMKRLNHLEQSTIQPGQQILIPIEQYR